MFLDLKNQIIIRNQINIMDIELKQKIINLEVHLIKPEIRASESELDRLLSDDFVELTSSGLTYNKKQVLAKLPNEIAPQFMASNFIFRELESNIIQLIYNTTIKLPDQTTLRYSKRSSIWKKNDCDWQMEFHQGTPCEPF